MSRDGLLVKAKDWAAKEVGFNPDYHRFPMWSEENHLTLLHIHSFIWEIGIIIFSQQKWVPYIHWWT